MNQRWKMVAHSSAAKLSTTLRSSRKCVAASSLIGMILSWMMLRRKYLPEIYSVGIEYITIQTLKSKRRPGVRFPAFFICES